MLKPNVGPSGKIGEADSSSCGASANLEVELGLYGPRSVLAPGDHFRVGGGPVYVTDIARPLVDAKMICKSVVW
jgi:hypothetical protein